MRHQFLDLSDQGYHIIANWIPCQLSPAKCIFEIGRLWLLSNSSSQPSLSIVKIGQISQLLLPIGRCICMRQMRAVFSVQSSSCHSSQRTVPCHLRSLAVSDRRSSACTPPPTYTACRNQKEDDLSASEDESALLPAELSEYPAWRACNLVKFFFPAPSCGRNSLTHGLRWVFLTKVPYRFSKKHPCGLRWFKPPGLRRFNLFWKDSIASDTELLAWRIWHVYFAVYPV